MNQGYAPQQFNQPPQYQQPNRQGLTCPRCGAHNVAVSMVQTGASTRIRNRGCLWQIGRLCLIICTAGLWLLIGKSFGKAKTKIKNKRMAVCQNCGNSWEIR